MKKTPPPRPHGPLPMGLYSPHHTIFVVLFIVLLVAAVLIFKYALKTQKARNIFIRCMGGLLTVSLLLNRIALTLWDDNGIGIREMIPNTYCGMSGLLLGIITMTGKPGMKIFHFLVCLEFFGGLACVFYPTFLLQGPSFFFFPTITGMNHHACGAILCVLLIMGNWYRPAFKNWAAFPLGICAYTIFGLFLLDVLKIRHTMIIDEPIIPRTPFKWWFVLIFGTALETTTTFACEKISALVAKKRLAAAAVKQEIKL